MDNLDDYELQKTEPPPVPRRTLDRRLPLWLVTAAGLFALVSVVFFFVGREQAQAPPAPEPPGASDPAPPPDRPLGAAWEPVEPIELPPLDETDAVVRRLVGALSLHTGVAAWLATDGLIRTFVVAVENIATGQTPAKHLRALKPAGAFRVIERDEHLVADPRSYARYSQIAGVVQSFDAGGAARVYATLKSRIEQAYRELGHQESFDRALERTIVALLEVPVLDDDVTMAPKGALYVYDDPRIERLTAAQKQLARMGPRNVRVIQAKLRDVALELGMRAERLPAQPANLHRSSHILGFGRDAPLSASKVRFHHRTPEPFRAAADNVRWNAVGRRPRAAREADDLPGSRRGDETLMVRTRAK